MTAAELPELEAFAVELALGAGEITLGYFKQPITVERKSDGSFVTNADREAEEYLRRTIESKFPADSILGEEGGLKTGRSGRCWVLDPIDGTFSFVHGVPFYGVLVALLVGDEPLVGVVNVPALGEVVSASASNGCRWNGKSARVSSVSQLSDSLLVGTDFDSCARYGFGPGTAKLASEVKSRRTWGDCYGYVLVATGRAEIMLDPVMNVWDCAPMLPIMAEAGGTFTDWSGSSRIDGGNAVATNGLLFEDVMQTITASA